MILNSYLGRNWNLILFGLVVVGFALLLFVYPAPEWIRHIGPQIHPDKWFRLLGIYLLSIAITHLVVFWTLRGTGKLLELKGAESRPDMWASTLVGIAESVLYPTAMIIGQSEFIGLWLGLKVAGGWIRWGRSGGRPPDSNRDIEIAKEARRRFIRFLIGNALSIGFALVTYALIIGFVLVHPNIDSGAPRDQTSNYRFHPTGYAGA